MDDKRKEMLRGLPKIDEVILLLDKSGINDSAPREVVLEACRNVVQNLRDKIIEAKDKDLSKLSLDAVSAAGIVEQTIQGFYRYHLVRVVNATGVILHTNLGRAPLCPEALQRILEVGRGYSNLEFDLAAGERGQRYDHVSSLICALTGAEDALIVNNNAAAVLLVLNTLAEGKESIVSRGELIEIGGEFRIPEIMKKSSSILCEVGTTNRTRLADYEKAVSDATGLIMKVHTSNFRIVGFTEEAEIIHLVALGKKHAIPVYDDLGSGCLIDLDKYGLQHEPTVRDVLSAGVDVVTFSGDKLLGGPQAGIIAGKKEILAKIKKNPLNRALRIDKFTLAALEATLMQYLQPASVTAKLRSLQALTEPIATVKKRASELMDQLRKSNLEAYEFSLREDFAAAGGGSLPTEKIASVLVAVKSKKMTAVKMEAKLRALEVPMIVRVDKDEILIDLRTVAEDEFGFIVGGPAADYIELVSINNRPTYFFSKDTYKNYNRSEKKNMRLCLVPREMPKYGQDYRQQDVKPLIDLHDWPAVNGWTYQTPDWSSVRLIVTFNADNPSDSDFIEHAPPEVPVVAHFQLRWRYLDSKDYRDRCEKVLRRARCVIIPASFLVSELPNLNNRVEVVSNGVNSKYFHVLSDFEIAVIRKNLGIPIGKRVLGMIGELTKAKGKEIFDKLAAQLPKDWVLLLYSKVKPHEWVDGKHIFWVQQEQHDPRSKHITPIVDVLLSLSLCEVAPMVILEALVSGVGVVATCSSPYLAELSREFRQSTFQLVGIPVYLKGKSRKQLSLRDRDAQSVAAEVRKRIESFPSNPYSQRLAISQKSVDLELTVRDMASGFEKVYVEVERSHGQID